MTVFTVDRLGRKPIQIGGFAILTIIFCVLGFAWQGLTKIHLLVLYVLAQFFFNFGRYSRAPVSRYVQRLLWYAY
jgi:PHS family inorganic phosphate transporter-like MFS transporter